MTAQAGFRVGAASLNARRQHHVLQFSREGTGPQSASAMDLAMGGMRGGGHEVPYREEMERSFGGVDFSDVRAFTGSAAADANSSLDSHAYAVGNQIAFKTASPSKALVAHELTHVLQQTGGTQAQVDRSSDAGIDTAGEAEAEAVEAAVASGRDASTALTGLALRGGLARKVARSTGGGGDNKGKWGGGGGAVLSAGVDGFSAGGDINWGFSRSVPLGSVPVNLIAEAKLSAGAEASIGVLGHNQGDMEFKIFGSAAGTLGASVGPAGIAELYVKGTLGGEVAGKLTKKRNGGSQSEFEAELTFGGRVGVDLLSHYDKGIDLFKLGIVVVDGQKDGSGRTTAKLSWHSDLHELRDLLLKIWEIMNFVQELARQIGSDSLDRTLNIAEQFYNSPREAFGKAARRIGRFIWNPWESSKQVYRSGREYILETATEKAHELGLDWW